MSMRSTFFAAKANGRRGSILLLPALSACLLGLWGCPPTSTDPTGNPGSGTNRPATTGYAAILFLNSSSQLVQDIVSVEGEGSKPQIWVTPVAPDSWDALLVDYPFTRIGIIGATPVDLQTGLAGQQVNVADGIYADRDRVTAGSVIVVRTRDAAEAGGGLVIEVSTLPDPDRPEFELATSSATAPGAASGLAVIRPQVPEDIAATIRFTWEDSVGRVYGSSWAVSGVGLGVAALVECPLKRIGWGNLRDPALPGAVITSTGVELDAPAALRLADPAAGLEGFSCGDSVVLSLAADAQSPDGWRVDTLVNSQGSAVPAGAPDLFGNIRTVLDAEGFAGRLSNSSMLLPAPPEPPTE